MRWYMHDALESILSPDASSSSSRAALHATASASP